MDTPLQLPKRIDALPEYTDYADRGCDLFPSCLNCPLPRCRYEERGGAGALMRSGRDASIVAMADDRGMSVDALARMFGLSRRTIFRVLRSRACGNGPGRRSM
jgi:hypothetical protein